MKLTQNQTAIVVTVAALVGVPVLNVVSQQLSDGHFNWGPVGAAFFSSLGLLLLFLKAHYGSDVKVETRTTIEPVPEQMAAKVTQTITTTTKKQGQNGNGGEQPK